MVGKWSMMLDRRRFMMGGKWLMMLNDGWLMMLNDGWQIVDDA